MLKRRKLRSSLGRVYQQNQTFPLFEAKVVFGAVGVPLNWQHLKHLWRIRLSFGSSTIIGGLRPYECGPASDPSIVKRALPNAAHYALTALQQRSEQEAKKFTLFTQNIDGLHMKAGSEDVVELHGSLWKTRCTHCEDVQENHDMPICTALEGRGAPDPSTPVARIPLMELPRCKICNGLLRPHVVWFGENLQRQTVDRTNDALQHCDLLLVAGTSSVVWPAAGYAPLVRSLGGTVAEFNIEKTPASRSCRFKFEGTSSSTLPEALGISLDKFQHKLQP